MVRFQETTQQNERERARQARVLTTSVLAGAERMMVSQQTQSTQVAQGMMLAMAQQQSAMARQNLITHQAHQAGLAVLQKGNADAM